MGAMQPGHHAATRPDAPAVVMAGSGDRVTFAELDTASSRLANLFRERGLGPGSHLAVLLPNHPSYFEVVWAGLRNGMHVTPINWHLGPEEAGYIVEDCDADVIVTSGDLAELLGQMEPHLAGVRTRLLIEGDVAGFEPYEDAIGGQPSEAPEGEVDGQFMFYSSGTTGRPKGILSPLPGQPFGTQVGFHLLLGGLYGFGEDTTYLSPAPLYHAAPLGWSIGTQALGGTVVVMERFDPAGALDAIAAHRVTHAQFVPTHFVRMLKLPEATRSAADLSSLRTVIHAAAPCPVEVKRQMLEWWGPLLHEYYAGSEGNGFCVVGPDEWLERPGTVGRSIHGTVHVVDDEGRELPAGHEGQIWFESDRRFEYHKDPAKTAAAFDEHGWSTLGDVGYLDEDGYLFLTDRVSNMIISGGVNIYPREVEDVLVLHPAVADVAVIGVPDEEMGEQVLAVVQPADGVAADDVLAAELIDLCRSRIAHFKCPRAVEFMDELPRLPTGKLLKRRLLERRS